MLANLGEMAVLFLPTPSARRATLTRLVVYTADVVFLPTPSARRATRYCRATQSVVTYFYPRPPRGGRQLWRWFATAYSYFYPRPPRGGRPALARPLRSVGQISTHALREEGDKRTQTLHCQT